MLKYTRLPLLSNPGSGLKKQWLLNKNTDVMLQCDWPGLRCSQSKVKPHLVSSFTEVAEVPVRWVGGAWWTSRVRYRTIRGSRQEEEHYLWASSSSLTALSTAFRLLFSSFSTSVASLWSTRATLNISTVSLGATWRAWFQAQEHKVPI